MIQDLQNKAEAIRQELLTLKAKGYGNVDTSQIKGDISSLPPLSGATPTLPQTNETGLVGFKDTFAKVMELATQKRDDLLKQFMMPLKGTAAASDFSSILSNFSSGSDTTNKLLLNSLVPKPDTQIITETDASGRVIATTIDKISGKIVGTADLGIIGKPQIAEKIDNKIKEILTAGGLTETQINSIDEGVRKNGFDVVYEAEKKSGATPEQLSTLQKAYGVKPIQTKEEVEKDMRNLFTKDELHAMAKELGYASAWAGADTDITNMFKNATTEQLIRQLAKNVK